MNRLFVHNNPLLHIAMGNQLWILTRGVAEGASHRRIVWYIWKEKHSSPPFPLFVLVKVAPIILTNKWEKLQIRTN